MTRNFTEDANAIVVQAYEHATRLGHPKPRWFDPRPVAFAGRGGAYLPLGPGAGQALQHARRAAQARQPPSRPVPRTSHWASSPSAKG
jgi:hypothetical protein